MDQLSARCIEQESKFLKLILKSNKKRKKEIKDKAIQTEIEKGEESRNGTAKAKRSCVIGQTLTVGDGLIGLALADLSSVKFGSHIRMSELAKNLSIPLVYSRTQTRISKYLEYAPELLRHNDMLLFGSRPRFFDNLAIAFLKECGIRIIYDAADLPHLQNFYFAGGVINPSLERKLYSLVNFSNVLVIISESARNLFKKEAIKKKRVLIIPNASDPQFFKPSPNESRMKTILYVGSYAPARGVDDLVSAFQKLENKYKDICLRLIGVNMPLRFRSNRISVECDKIYSDMPRIHSESFLCVIPHKRNPYMNAALPVKLFDAMAAAKPLVVTDCPEVRNLVEKEKCGIVAHDNPDSLAEAIEDLLLNSETAEEMGHRGREAIIKRHSWKHRAMALKESLRL